jgi:hypothetical protein
MCVFCTAPGEFEKEVAARLDDINGAMELARSRSDPVDRSAELFR